MPCNTTQKPALRLKLTARKELLICIVEVPYDIRRHVAAHLGTRYTPSSDIRTMQDVETFLIYEEHAQAGDNKRRGVNDGIRHWSWA